MVMQSDEALAAGVQHGNQADLQVLVDRYYEPLLHYLFRTCGGMRLLAEDLTQDTFLRMLRGIDRYDPARPFKAWLYAIATHAAINYLSRADQRRVVEQDENFELESGEPASESLLEEAEQAQVIRQALASLPDHQRIVVVLFYYEEMPQADIAEMLGIPVGTVKSRLSLGLKRLREWIEQREGAHERG